MSSEAAFLQALREDPTDETTLLVFADWAEDQGDPAQAARGELLRVQAELARWVSDLQRRTELQARVRQLLRERAAEWLGPLGPFCQSWQFERGLTHVTMTVEQFRAAGFAARAEVLLNRAWVHRLTLTEARPHLAALAGSSHLRLLADLTLSQNGLTGHDISLLAAAPYLEGLRRLDLSNNRITDPGYRSLLNAPALQRLEMLDLRNNQIQYAPLLAVRRRLPRLVCLNLDGNDLPAEAQADLAPFRRWWAPRVFHNLPPRVVNSLGMELTLVPAGTFLMGSPDTESVSERSANGPPGKDERPRHAVTLTSPYYMGIYPVTQRQYEALLGSNPSEFLRAQAGGPAHPVENVTWDAARIFCEQLSGLPAERQAGRVYRLPTEAEWEHACRAGTTTAFFWGNTASSLQAWCDGSQPYGDTPDGPEPEATCRVGSFTPNAFGLFDMHGNVWEWCGDYYEQDYYAASPASDPAGPEAGNRKVARGGSWSNAASECRSACRDYWYGTSYARSDIGFRVVMTVGRR